MGIIIGWHIREMVHLDKISYVFDNLLVGCLFNDKLGSKYYIIVWWPYCSFNYNLSQSE